MLYDVGGQFGRALGISIHRLRGGTGLSIGSSGTVGCEEAIVRILIIGGTGNISTSITRELRQRGEDVTLYNRGKTDADIPAGVHRLCGDRKQYGEFERHMADAGPFDCVIDMICYLPADAESLVRAFSNQVQQIIFTSTVEVYSKPRDRYPVPEEHRRGVTSEYGGL